MRLLIILLILFVPPLLAVSCPHANWSVTVRLKKINDGDTITLENGRLVRFVGINTPEINHRNQNKSEPYAIEAKSLLEKYLHAGDRLYLVFDKIKQDKYGRLLACLCIQQNRT